jgi:hypothetical protein
VMDEHRETPNSKFSELMDSTSMPTLASPVTDVCLTTVVDPTLPVLSAKRNHTPVLLYDKDTSDQIFLMATTATEERSKPFLQRTQPTGPDNYVVRATGQIDDGAMRNCISKRRRIQYGHCLSELQPSSTRISIANGVEISPIG